MASTGAGGPTHDFSGRRVLVVGGTRGLGLAAAHAFADAGAAVTVTGTHAMTAYYDDDLSRFAHARLELTARESADAVVARTERLDVLVLAASARIPPTADPAEREFVEQAAHLGLLGPVHLATRLRFRLGQSTMGGGGSVIALPPARRWFELGPGRTEAACGLSAATRRLGASWAPLGVRVNSVVDDPAVPTQGRLRVQIERSSGPLMTRSRPRRAASAREVTDLALLLAGPGAAALTGHTLSVALSRR